MKRSYSGLETVANPYQASYMSSLSSLKPISIYKLLGTHSANRRAVEKSSNQVIGDPDKETITQEIKQKSSMQNTIVPTTLV